MLELGLLAAGAFGGFLVGVLGIGGGLIYVVVLHTVFGRMGLDEFESTRFVLANAILLQGTAGVVAAWGLRRAGELRLREALLVGLPATAVTAALSLVVKSADWYRREYFLVLFLVFLAVVVARAVSGAGAGSSAEWQTRPWSVYLFTGLGTGVVSAFAGLAGGIFIIPWLSERHGLPLRQAIAIAIPAVVPSTFGNTLVYLLDSGVSLAEPHTGYVVWSVSGPMALGILLCTQLGVVVGRRAPVALLRRVFAGLLVLMAGKLLVVDVLSPAFGW